MSDRQLYMGRSKEDEECFKTLFRDYFASMCVFADHYLDDEEMAKDVVHDVFCEIWENPMRLEHVTNMKNFLYTIVKNRSLDILRREYVRHRCAERLQLEMKENEEYFEEEILREEVYRMLDDAIQLLPERSREILLLKLQGLKNQEIADKLDISVNTVNTLKANAYKVLREQLKDKHLRFLLFFVEKIDF